MRVPFPYTDRNTRQHRPALVISNGAVGDNGALLWVAMITSAANRPWPEDRPIAAYAEAGLPIPSVVRPAKITTIEARDAETIGAVDDETRAEIMTAILSMLSA